MKRVTIFVMLVVAAYVTGVETSQGWTFVEPKLTAAPDLIVRGCMLGVAEDLDPACDPNRPQGYKFR
jgi:hypothetical protein